MYTWPSTDLAHKQLLAKHVFEPILLEAAISPSRKVIPSVIKVPAKKKGHL